MKFAITFTASKLMAFLMLGCAVYLGKDSFMFAVPFIAALVLGKQWFDKGKVEPKPE
jgi:hypothetical protein